MSLFSRFGLGESCSLDGADIGSGIHVLRDGGLRVQVAIHVRPSLVLGNLVDLGLVAVLLDHFRLLVGQLDLVVQKVLSVCEVLDGPSLLLGFLSLPDALIVLDLLGSGGIDLVDSLWFEAFEVVWDVSVPAELGCGGHWVLCHEVVHVGAGDLPLVHVLLLVSPGLLAILLLLSQHLIILLHLLELLILLLRHLVLQNASHSCDGLRLMRISSLLILQ